MRPVSTKIETPHLCQSGQKAPRKDVVAKRCNADNDLRTKNISRNDRNILKIACRTFESKEYKPRVSLCTYMGIRHGLQKKYTVQYM